MLEFLVLAAMYLCTIIPRMSLKDADIFKKAKFLKSIRTVRSEIHAERSMV